MQQPFEDVLPHRKLRPRWQKKIAQASENRIKVAKMPSGTIF